MSQELVNKIRHLSPCSEAAAWLANYAPGEEQKAWAECERGDWMLWLLGRLDNSQPWSDERKPLVLAAMKCALLVEHLWSEQHRAQISQAVGTILRWVNGTASVEEAKEGRKQFRIAATTTIYAAAYAAAAAYAYAYAYAAAAADAAYAYADAADADAARKAARKKAADEVRKVFPHPPQLD